MFLAAPWQGGAPPRWRHRGGMGCVRVELVSAGSRGSRRRGWRARQGSSVLFGDDWDTWIPGRDGHVDGRKWCCDLLRGPRREERAATGGDTGGAPGDSGSAGHPPASFFAIRMEVVACHRFRSQPTAGGPRGLVLGGQRCAQPIGRLGRGLRVVGAAGSSEVLRSAMGLHAGGGDIVCEGFERGPWAPRNALDAEWSGRGHLGPEVATPKVRGAGGLPGSVVGICSPHFMWSAPLRWICPTLDILCSLHHARSTRSCRRSARVVGRRRCVPSGARCPTPTAGPSPSC